MFCGSSSFHHDADDNPSSSPKASKKKSHRNKNPYSSRGLDKFTSVLSELEAKRQKIMATTGAQGISMVRFMYSNSEDWIPIVVRIREDRNSDGQIVAAADKKPEEVPAAPVPEKKVEKRLSSVAAPLPWWKWRSSYFMPAMVVLILVCLAVFGRVFAICCASIWWYLVPTFKDDERMKRRVSKKKEYVKRLSDKRLPATAATQGKKMQELGSPRGHTGKKE